MIVKRRLQVSTHHLHRPAPALAGLALATAVLQLAATTGMAYVSGFSHFVHVLAGVRWYWLIVTVGALGVSLVGYHFACRGVYERSGGPRLRPDQMRSVTIAGFGGFLAEGGSALDKYALQAGGADERQADTRVLALAGLEHGVLGLIGTVAAIALLAGGNGVPPLDYSVPWAVLPVPGFLLAFWSARRFGPRIRRENRGWRRLAGLFVDCLELIRGLFVGLFEAPPAIWGMVLFWVAEMFAVWAGVAAFGFDMRPAPLVIGVGTGMVFTRRTGPLTGAGVMLLTLSASLYVSGAPLAMAVAGVFAYRVLSVWLTMPLAVAQLPRLRTMGMRRHWTPSEAKGLHKPVLVEGQAG